LPNIIGVRHDLTSIEGTGATDAVFTALADAHRRLLLDRLRTGEATLAQLCVGLPMSRQAVSKHLALLQSAGLVSVRSAGRHRIHALNPVPLSNVSGWLADYERLWEDALGRLAWHITENP